MVKAAVTPTYLSSPWYFAMGVASNHNINCDFVSELNQADSVMAT